MRLLKTAAALVAVAGLAGTPAVADAAPSRDAQRFADAVARGKQSLLALRPMISVRTYGAIVEVERCEAAMEGVHADAVERRLEEQGSTVVWAMYVYPYVELHRPMLRQVVADLDAIPTRDPALRAGREAWRRGLRLFEALPPPLPDPCGALERWRDASFTAEAAPLTRADAERFWEILARTDDERDRRFARAVKRLRALGVSPRRARAFDGRRLLDLWSDDH